MKTIVYIITISLSFGLISSCEKESTLFETVPHEDEEAVEGMEHALESAEIYNDSLIWCADIANTCDQSFILYCDSIFHHEMEEYEEHHSEYSHNNVSDDHHHSATSQHHHGAPNSHEDDSGGHGGGHGHNLENHEHMMELAEHHNEYHPL